MQNFALAAQAQVVAGKWQDRDCMRTGRNKLYFEGYAPSA
jgi:hypothetical protein